MSDTDCPGTNNRGEPCGLDAGWGTDSDEGPCKYHGGAGGDVGNTRGAPEGNSNAEGNDGGAPEGNGNATKHFAFRKPKYLQEDIRGTEYEDVFIASFEALCTRHEDVYGSSPDFFFKRRYRRLVLLDIKEDLIDAYMAERQGSARSENPLVEEQIDDIDGRMRVERANKLLHKLTDFSREIRLALKDYGLLQDPQSETASAQQDVADALREYMTQINE